jgi:hypothetical protein
MMRLVGQVASEGLQRGGKPSVFKRGWTSLFDFQVFVASDTRLYHRMPSDGHDVKRDQNTSRYKSRIPSNEVQAYKEVIGSSRRALLCIMCKPHQSPHVSLFLKVKVSQPAE